MSLESVLIDIVAKLRQGKFPNESAISQGIVLRVLSELGWDTFDTTIVWPEYQTGEGRADYALCHPHSKPILFIEVKQPGKAEDAVRQALEYAFHTGVRFVVLTDGRTWSFYLPAEEGSYEDRRVYKLDLYERTVVEAAEALNRYLGRDRIVSGIAIEEAQEEYRNRSRRSQTKAAIPEAWCDLCKTDELTQMLTNAVESKVGVKPDHTDIVEFLVKLEAQNTEKTIQSNSVTQKQNGKLIRKHNGTICVLGRQYEYRTDKDAMLIVLRKLAEQDSSFLLRLSQHRSTIGISRHYITKTRAEFSPNSPHLSVHCEELPGKWFVFTHSNSATKGRIIRAAAEVSGTTIDCSF